MLFIYSEYNKIPKISFILQNDVVWKWPSRGVLPKPVLRFNCSVLMEVYENYL